MITLLMRRVRHLTQIGLKRSCACVVGYPSTIEWEHIVLNKSWGNISQFGHYVQEQKDNVLLEIND